MNPIHRKRMSSPVWLLALSLGLGAATGHDLAAAPDFLFLGDLEGGSDYSIALGVSADGTYVVGGSSSSASGAADQFVQRTEAFVWDATRGLVPLGDIAGGDFRSLAYDVTADGNAVVGTSSEAFRSAAFLWLRGSGMQRFGPTLNHERPDGAGAATVIANDGSRVLGSLKLIYFCGWFDCLADRGFLWESGSPLSSLTVLSTPVHSFSPFPSHAGAVNASGVIAGTDTSTDGEDFGDAFRWARGGFRESLGRVDDTHPALPSGISADGRTIVGMYIPPLGPPDIFGNRHRIGTNGAFVWREGREPPFEKLPELFSPPEGIGAVGVSANGRVILNRDGGFFLDGHGPFDVRRLLADYDVIDLEELPPADFRANALADNGLVCVGSAVVGGVTRAWRLRLSDCDGNGLPDELERFVFGSETSRLIAEGSERFAAARETLGYGDMISHYGRPWKPGTGRTPTRDPEQPAEFLRSSLRLEGCIDGGALATVDAAERFLIGVALPATQELHGFEMLLGNEAFADALDPTIGLDGVAANDVSDRFAFEGASGVQELIDEELALLRGRELPGAPSDWLNEAVYYPQVTGLDGSSTRVAIYNRLPPHAVGDNGLAYRSNYRVVDNYQAALKFPQGHGDAYGHYLSALRAGIALLRDGAPGWPEEFLEVIAAVVVGTDAGLETVRQLAGAAAARAQCVAQATDLLHRRDYREDLKDPRARRLFEDVDPQRAWSMGQWARRGAGGAFLDWALASHWAPTDETRTVHRGNLPELEELASAVSGFQGRLDTAGSGLDPLGLVQNVVPFGIDASGLQPGSGRSHYEQVRDAASRALENARKAFESANQANQRLRDSDRAFGDFANKLADQTADFDQQIIEIFGLSSPDDPLDNDLDPTTDDFTESQSLPDLRSFLLTDEDLAAKGMGPRLAPGQVQLALAELRMAGLRIEQTEVAIDELAAQVRSQTERIELLIAVQIERIEIITKARDDQIALTRRLEQLEERKKNAGMIGSFFKGVVTAAATGDPSAAIGFISQVVSDMAEQLMEDDGELQTPYDVEAERTRVQAWKEIELQGLEDKLQVHAETAELKALLRRSPQLLLDRSVALELALHALGRMQQTIARGKLVLEHGKRIKARTEGERLAERWRDMSFRVFRNAALKNYRAFFDIATRYVVLAARAYAYEFDSRSDGEDVLAGIYRERRLGSAVDPEGGLESVLARIDGAVTVNNFNRPLETLGERSFSLRRNLLGIGADDFPNDDLDFRRFLETQIVERLEDLAEVTELAQVSIDRDYGPAIVIAFSTEIDSRNFFGRGPELPFGNSNFSLTRNAKIRSYAIRLDGVDASLGTDPESGTVFVYLLPAGDSVLRESSNKPRIEDELITPWAVVDQFLPPPPLAPNADFAKRSYNPWRSNAQVSGNFLNEIKRQRDSEAQIELGQSSDETRYNTNLAGRSAWNTRWLLVIPGSQWTSSSHSAAIRNKLLQFIYGTQADPEQHVGITDIRLIIQAYSH